MQTFDSLKKEWLKDEIRRSLLFEETSSNLHQGDKICKAVVQIGTPFLGTRAVLSSDVVRPGSWLKARDEERGRESEPSRRFRIS